MGHRPTAASGAAPADDMDTDADADLDADAPDGGCGGD
jgi:hypothetical protein